MKLFSSMVFFFNFILNHNTKRNLIFFGKIELFSDIRSDIRFHLTDFRLAGYPAIITISNQKVLTNITTFILNFTFICNSVT